MSGLLWITAAFMQLAAVIAYSVIGFGVAFVLLEIFVIVSIGLTVLAIAASSRRSREESSTITRIVRGGRR